MLTDLFRIILIGLANEPDGVWKKDFAIVLIAFELLPFFVFFIRNVLHGFCSSLISFNLRIVSHVFFISELSI